MKSNLDSIFKTNKSLESEGIWLDISEEVGFKVKRFGGYNSSEVKLALSKLYKPYAKMIENNALSESKEREINVRVFVESTMTDWKGVEIDGKIADFSIENAVKLLLGLPDLFDTLVKHASDYSNYKEEYKQDLGNF